MTEIITGTDAIRQALKARSKDSRAVNIARDVGISSQLLNNFLDGKNNLSPEILNALTTEIWHGHALYDAETDRLVSANREPPKAFATIRPEPFNADAHPSYHVAPAGAWSQFSGVKGLPPQAYRKPPGWAD
ncbi:hypothetical protein [Bradyrhizobium sp. sBnM-33]|uniref:hypothetical protein n=1 Tax=Bradyrhizobium sp. sBnM-33 TaxID=2831780 RepID=UPI001BCFB263|nr:hypothetical protein [Bradyrhizobium sp. sBnM-33]WOH47618.1 hypothetical protein RX328_25990 [Bradyrhizobium sp. sBnM-33]